MRYLIHIILFLYFSCYTAFSGIDALSSEKGDKCGIFLSLKQKQQILNALCNEQDANGRCIQQKTFPSPSGKFLVHFDTSGKNAVNLKDNDLNRIPDYIDSVAYYFDYAYRIEVDSIGYLPPASDDGHGGSDAYDVYVLNLGDYHFNPSPIYGWTREDFSINPQRKFTCWTSYIWIDNDYSPFDSKINDSGDTIPTYTANGIMALKITAAHEFHHAIQLTYGIPTPGTESLMEMTSTWMENRLFPESKDYFQYLKILFKNPGCNFCAFGNGDYRVGYIYGIFGQFSYLSYRDVILKRLWQLIGCDIAGYMALDSAYKEQGTNLADEWCRFLPWLYYTGSRAIPGQYFPDASEFPEITFKRDTIYTNPSLMDGGSLKPFELRAFRYRLPSDNNKSDDTLDIIVTNTDLKSAIIQGTDDKQFSILCTNSQQSGTRQIGDTRYYYGIKAEEGDVFDSLFFSSGLVFYTTSPVFPNPFKTSIHDKLYFPVPSNTLTNEKVQLKIYKTDMNEVFNKELDISIYKNIKAAVLEKIPDILTSGVYIFSISYNGSMDFGKVVIIRD
ncbi:MAG: hypothetical protein EPN82_10585 [Bacteroidetes bacterium]|nr:MAG: hypothetical protein EPN82_10585 [Bacteroidota bacterium]